MSHGEHLQELSFDLYERYILLEPIGKFFRPEGAGYRVLDVGGHTPALGPGFSSLAGALIPDASVVLVDVRSAEGPRNYIQASGWQLPFRDDSFDLVCSLDTMEHIPAEHRQAFLAELLRVTRDGLYLAFPFDSPGNRWAESLIAEYTGAVLQSPLPALLEHRQFGLPDRESVANSLGKSPHSWIGFEQGNTDVWLLMMLTYHSLRMHGTDFVAELNRRFNQVYAAQDWAGPAYRAGYLLSKRRCTADLEAVRASFGSAGRRADLQGVLAFCLLFLNIAQNARVTADKDRHIRNIEAELAKVSARPPRMQQELLARLDRRLRDLEISQATNKRAIQAIYDSRIWKVLASAGGLLLRLGGHRGRPYPGAPRRQESRQESGAAHPAARGVTAAPDEFVALMCDYPGYAVQPVRGVVEIRGWALANSGIDRVLIQIDGEPPAIASYGISRPDVVRSYPQVEGAEHSGYRFFWDTAGLREGPRAVRITAVARSGQTRETTCNVIVDWNAAPDYDIWIARNEPAGEDLQQMRLEAGRLTRRPRISIVTPVYRTAVALLTRAIDSVVRQTYPEWELCIADDGSHDPGVASLLQQYALHDPRIRTVTLERNRGIAAATNAALRLCSGDFVAFLDHDDELAPFALSEAIRAVNEHPDTHLFYSDEDKIDGHGRRYDPFFKPDWSPDLFLSYNYICHFVVMRRDLAERLGGLDESYNGAQDYEFLLRASECTQKIKRIPKVLYHWRAVAGSTARGPDEKPGASADGRRALECYLARNAPGARVEEAGACRYRVRYPVAGSPRVSILIPTAGHRNVFRAVDEILEKTTYRDFEIVLIDNSRGERVRDLAAGLMQRNAPVRLLDLRGRPFNFAALCNEAARASACPYLLFLNDDTLVITPEWLTAMLEHAQRREVGAVGAQLWYPNDVIQHAGVVMGLYGNCSHAFKGVAAGVPYYFDFPNLIRNCSAVTGACLLVAREKFFEAGAFDEVNLAVAFQDVDLCLKLLELGYRNVYTPYARLYHYESATKTEKDKIPDAVEDEFMKSKWAKYIADDPYYNPNLARLKEDFSLATE